MYLHQIQSLKANLLSNPRFEACTLTGQSNGIKILSVIKLPNEINQNQHNCFVDLDTYRGLYYWIVGGDKNYYFLKPDEEVGSDVPLYGTLNSIRIVCSDGRYSQSIDNLSADHTNYGHSSYYVLATIENTVTIPDDTWLPNETEILAELKALRDRLDKLDKLIKELHG